MTSYNPGDKSSAVCQSCETVVPTTFALRDVPCSDGSGTVPGVLAAVCDLCGDVVAIPAQSTAAITAAVAESLSAISHGVVPEGGKS
jgi:hypothetical protein